MGDLNYNGDPTDHLFTETLLRNIIKNVKPDLVVITGDIVDPEKWRNYQLLYDEAMKLFLELQMPWVWTGPSAIKNLSRDKILYMDQNLDYTQSWSGYKWNIYDAYEEFTEEELGYFTSRIPVMDKSGKAELFSIYTFDSEDFPCSVGTGLSGANCIGGNAISWFSEQQNLFSHGL